MQLLNDLTLSAILSRLAGYLIFCALHGAVLIAVLRFIGQERTATEGRLSFSPLVNLALSGLLSSVLFRVGWTRPIAIDPRNIRNARTTLVLAALAPLALSAATLPLIDMLRVLAAQGLPRTSGYAVLQVLVALQSITKASVVLNALPLPGLTAGLLLYAFAPQWHRKFNRYAPAIQIGLVLTLIAGFWSPL